MKIIAWLNSPFDVLYALVAFIVWFILWHLINFITSKVLKKCDINYDLMGMGPILAPIASFGIAILFTLIILLLIASIQAVIEYGIKLLFPFLIFWGGFIAFAVFFIKKFKE